MLTIDSLHDILEAIGFPGYTFFVKHEDGRMYLQATFEARCERTAVLATQHTRKWYLSNQATRSEVVQTALKLVLTSVEHEARESFRYRGRAIFGPHFNVDALHGIAVDDSLELRA